MTERNTCVMKKCLIIGLVSVLVVSWCLTPIEAKSKEEIYQEKLVKLKPDDVNGHYQLGRWCAKNKLPEQAKTQFEKVIELKPDHNGALKKLGYTKHKDEWLTPFEMKALGFAKYKGKWIAQEKYEKIWLQDDKLIQLEPPNGSIGRPGADKENIPWSEARHKETDHFIVETNLSFDALQDICLLMECAFLKWRDILSLSTLKEKPYVWVCKNREDFERVYKDIMGKAVDAASQGRYLGKDSAGNRLEQDVILTYYFWSKNTYNDTRRELIRNGPVWLLYGSLRRAVGMYAPEWLAAGLISYFKTGDFKGTQLLIKYCDSGQLKQVKKGIEKNKYIKLADLINMSRSEYNDYPGNLSYAQGASLVHFLANDKDGRYQQELQSYIQAYKKKKFTVTQDGDRICIEDKGKHLKVFEQCMGMPIDQLEEEWKEYIRKLK